MKDNSNYGNFQGQKKPTSFPNIIGSGEEFKLLKQSERTHTQKNQIQKTTILHSIDSFSHSKKK
jgi:hypothetical protein